jgi:hypothetical protein
VQRGKAVFGVGLRSQLTEDGIATLTRAVEQSERTLDAEESESTMFWQGRTASYA